MYATLPLLEVTDFPPVQREKLETLQVNLGYLCNQTCEHCHVNAGPRRKEIMEEATVRTVLDYLTAQKIQTLDLTGGAPEMNPHFRHLVRQARALGVHVIDRCNLTILEEGGYEDMPVFLADNDVEIIASMPCYLEENVNAQRGVGVFETSIRVLRRLNALGYGHKGSGLIQRFGSMLISKGKFNEYMLLLKGAYREENLESVMCRNLISVDWRGYVYDCDFNQMLGLPLRIDAKPRWHLRDLIGRDLDGNPVAVMNHCYGCTAGQGSSCGGSLQT